MNTGDLEEYLNKKVDEFNQPFFIENDPISIPHLFSNKPDIEIAGFFAAIFSLGNRTTIIQKTKELMQRMDISTFECCKNHEENDIQRLKGVKHRTFNEDDLLYFVEFFHRHYQRSDTLETAFLNNTKKASASEGGFVGAALNGFKKYFFSFEHLKRTEKHVSSP